LQKSLSFHEEVSTPRPSKFSLGKASRKASTADMKALRAEKYPELQLTQMGIKHSNQFANAPLMIMVKIHKMITFLPRKCSSLLSTL
jgi:hypothetical protein